MTRFARHRELAMRREHIRDALESIAVTMILIGSPVAMIVAWVLFGYPI